MGKKLNAYEKMLKDGRAFKKVNMQQPTPENPEGGFGVKYDPEVTPDANLFEDHMNKSTDDIIEQAKRLKESKTGKPITNATMTPSPSSMKVGNKKVKELERRISILEQALQLVMETQSKLLREEK